jgi:uncharacterized membrane protein YfcA
MIQPKNKKMDAQTLIILILIGLASGILGGMVGIGGGIIIVPALVYFLSFSQKMAQGTSLAILLLPIGLLGVIQFYKQGYIDIRFSIIIALAFFFGSYFGSRLALSMSQESVKKIFAILMLLIALKMLFLDKAKEASHIDTDTTTHPYT